jgi:hypothetical protein
LPAAPTSISKKAFIYFIVIVFNTAHVEGRCGMKKKAFFVIGRRIFWRNSLKIHAE